MEKNIESENIVVCISNYSSTEWFVKMVTIMAVKYLKKYVRTRIHGKKMSVCCEEYRTVNEPFSH